MRKIAGFLAVVACVACNYDVDQSERELEEEDYGAVSVTIEYEDAVTKALTDYTTALDEEKKVNNISVFVFDKSTGKLNSYKELTAVGQACTFNVTTGEKRIYALLNGSGVGSVTTETQLKQIVDDLSVSDIATDGLVMFGSGNCTVEEGEIAEPVISVKRLVSRVVLRSIVNKVPKQYGSMTVNCVYLSNANTKQSLSGTVSGTVNPNGYEDSSKTKPIGKNGITGSCPGYLYRAVNKTVAVGASHTDKYHMYCQPSGSGTITCVYLLATIGGSQYYYRVPLQNGIQANKTYSIDVEIVNLGAALPPDGDIQKGEIKATVNVSGWDAGDSYVVEF